jgi:hypothetical protein
MSKSDIGLDARSVFSCWNVSCDGWTSSSDVERLSLSVVAGKAAMGSDLEKASSESSADASSSTPGPCRYSILS